MKQQFTKVFIMLILGTMISVTGFSQTIIEYGGHGHKYTEPDPVRGSDWEIFHFPVLDENGQIQVDPDNPRAHLTKAISYYTGGHYDNLVFDGRNLGHHFMGSTIEELDPNEEFFLCNVATGEYLQVGDYWGESSMTNEAGISYRLEVANVNTKSAPWSWSESEAVRDKSKYWICPVLTGSNKSNRAIGRMNVSDGVAGSFEHNRFLALREKEEYDAGSVRNYPANKVSHPGTFAFMFEPVDLGGGKIGYIIYTHRHTTEKTGNWSEYGGRSSYLLIKSAGPIRSGYNAVRFTKFAGLMAGEGNGVYGGSQNISTYPSMEDEIELFDANKPYVPLDEGIRNVKGDMHNVWKIVTLNDRKRHRLVASEDEPSDVTFRLKNPKFYTAYRYYMEVGGKETASNTAVASEAGITSGTKTYVLQSIIGGVKYYISEKDNGSGYNRNWDAENTSITDRSKFRFIYNDDDGTWKIQNIFSEKYWGVPQTSTNASGDWKYLLPQTDAANAGAWTLNFKDGMIYPTALDAEGNNHGIDLANGSLVTFTVDNTSVWKALEVFEVNRSEPSTSSNRATWDAEKGQWTSANIETDYGWTWFNDDRSPHLSPTHHVHPYDLASGDKGWYNPEKDKREFHKVGTGYNYRYMGANNTSIQLDEFMLTSGQEANYVGSIWKGSANIQQTVHLTGDKLREGMYLVCVKGFFAPHDMMKYKEDGGTYKYGTSTLSDATWQAEAKVAAADEPGTGGKNDTNKWRRSHDSYLFAWSNPNGTGIEEVRRCLPSVYEGAVKLSDIESRIDLSKEDYINSDEFKYSQVGSDPTKYSTAIAYMRDSVSLARFNGSLAGTLPTETNINSTDVWAVPRTPMGAARWFNMVEDAVKDNSLPASYKNIANYRIVLPVYVGSDGELTIGVDHTNVESPVTYTRSILDEDGNPTGETEDITIPASGQEEWVCFDDFALIYLGKEEPDEFVVDELHGEKNIGPFPIIDGATGEETGEVSDEQLQQNNTQWVDIFGDNDIATMGKKVHTVKNVIIRRSLTKDGWANIVLPVGLGRARIEQAFGEKTQISRLSGFTGRYIQYEASNDTIMPGVTYVIKPSAHPVIPKGKTYTRRAFTLAASQKLRGVAGWYIDDGVYDKTSRNFQVEREMQGPIYVAPDVTIDSETTFPGVEMEEYTDTEDGNKKKWRKKVGVEHDYARWANMVEFNSGTYEIRGKEHLGKFKLVETSWYRPVDNVDENDEPRGIPANSYYHSGGKMYYTTKKLDTKRGLNAFLQMVHQEGDAAGTAYAKPWIEGSDLFVEVFEDPEVTGIEDVNNRPDPDGKIEIYDLMGRKAKTNKPGLYIMNGVKMLIK